MRSLSIAIALSLTGVTLLTSSSDAEAATFNVLGFGQYDITTLQTSYNASTTFLQSQPWWGSSSAALTFASTVGSSFGAPLSGFYGPLFAYSIQNTNPVKAAAYSTTTIPQIQLINADAPSIFPYAVATPVTSTVPEPSEVLATLAFGAIGAGYLLKRHRSKVA